MPIGNGSPVPFLDHHRILTVNGVPTTTPRLTNTSYSLLGAIAKAGSSSPYDLKRVLANSVGPLWEVPHSQIYDEAARLARAGLLTEQQEGSGRRRLSYTVTEEGRRELVRWLRMPSRDRVDFHDVGLLKLAYASELQPAELRHVAGDHLEAWQALGEEIGANMDGPGAQYVLAMVGAAVRFWSDMCDEISDSGPVLTGESADPPA